MGEEVQAFVAKAQTTYEAGLEMIQDMLGWSKIAQTDEIVCYRKPNADTNFDSLKVEIYIPKPPSEVSKYVHTNWNEINMELDEENIESQTLVKNYAENVDLYYVVGKARTGVASRDLSYLLCMLQLDEATFAMVGTSVDAGIPVKEGAVRGELITALHLFGPVSGDATKTHYQVVMLFDPKGQLPAALVN